MVLDAGVLIAQFQTDDADHVAVRALLEEYEEFEFAASSITVAECLVRAAAAGATEPVLEAIHRLGVLIFDVTAADAAGIAAVRASTGLRMPDAVALHAAELRGGILATTDRTLARAAVARGVEVAEP